jgi:DNA mismatch repair protein MutS2
VNAHSLEVLEFEKVRRMLSRWTFSFPGRDLLGHLTPELDPAAILLSQQRISEWKRLELTGNAPGPAALEDLRPHLLRLRRSAEPLDGRELYAFLPFLDHLGALARLKRELSQHAGSSPRLMEILAPVGDYAQLRARLACSVSPEGELLDSASPELGRIRQELLNSQQRAADLLEDLRVRVEQNRDDSFVTLREGRYVLSVRAAARSVVPGLVHGRSHSGQSLLLEPLEAVEMNNRVAEARDEERQEVVRILHELTGHLREETESLSRSWSVAGLLDLVRAQALLALELRAEPPELNEEGYVRLVQARHPILAEAEAKGGVPVVPLSLELFPERPVLVISGPNMGGKTVALKTVGLLLLMARAGLHVPAADGTSLPLADDLFVDLGDEQSIEGDVSTFAGHLRNVKDLWEGAGPRSIVLLDELGGGTDPEEGSALAMALLEGMARRGTMTLATTHLTSVKFFVSEQPKMQNAAMEFDSVSMSPRFRLKLGEPGGSRAFEIARRILGRSDLLQAAEGYRSPLLVQMDQVLAQADGERRRLEEERKLLEAEREALRQAEVKKQKQAARLKERLEKIRTDRETALGRIYGETEQYLRGLRESLEAKAKEKPASVLPEVRRAERELQEKSLAARRERRLPRGRRLRPEQALPGGSAWLPSVSAVVRIERLEGGRAWVEWMGRRLEVPLANLEEVPDEHKPAAPAVRLPLALDGPPEGALLRELDLRGCRAEEALEQLDRFLDRAALQRVRQVRIIHGKGTGALKREVEKALKVHPLVTSFRMGELAEGGWGVTVAELGSAS